MAYTASDVAQTVVITWDAITGATSGTAYRLDGARALAGAVQVTGGTAGSMGLQVSNDGINWATLKDLFGTDIALTALTQMADFTTAARYIRPTGNGSSSAAVVTMALRG